MDGPGVAVGLIDSGWRRMRSDARVLPGVGIVAPTARAELVWSEDDDDRIGHGTLCATILFRIAPRSLIVPIRVFGRRLETMPAAIERAIHWAVDRKIRLLNLSLGTTHQGAIAGMYSACARASAAGTIIVAATARGGVSYPAAFDNVISVDVGPVRNVFDYAYRPDEPVECIASGAYRDKDDIKWVLRSSGSSSAAAPKITGLIAQMLERRPELDLHGVRALLAENAMRA